MFGFRQRRRARIRTAPFPEAWLAIVERNVPYWRRLTEEERAELRGHILVFLAEKTFVGCGGLLIDDEIRVTIAAQACLLLLHRDAEPYPLLRSVLVYPHAYVAMAKHRLPDGTVIEGPQGRLGESWRRGAVVLSWDDVLKGAHDIHDGHNVVFHEFAHQLDGESGADEGAPNLPRRSMVIAWARVLGREYEKLRDDVEHHRETVLDDYGATHPAEFFAVVTECFFEKPLQLKRRHPEMYDLFKSFFRQDPAAREADG